MILENKKKKYFLKNYLLFEVYIFYFLKTNIDNKT